MTQKNTPQQKKPIDIKKKIFLTFNNTFWGFANNIYTQ